MHYIHFFVALTFFSCAQEPKAPATPPEMRHGWSVFTGPKRTVVDVNDAYSVERGRRLFERHCQSCHGPDGEGNGPMARSLNIQPANLKSLSKKMPNYYLTIQINKGEGNMPKWQDMLTPQEVWQLTSYIQTLSQRH